MSEPEQFESSLVVPDSQDPMRVPLADTQMSMRTLQALMGTPSIPTRYTESPTGLQDLYAAYLVGRELGIGPMESFNSLYLVNGSISMLGRLMCALIWRHGHRIEVQISQKSATAIAYRRDPFTKELFRAGEWTFTAGDAEKAYLDSKSTYEDYPKLMWSWRAISALTRIYFADCISGTSGYVPEEAGIADAPVEPLPENMTIEVDGNTIANVELETATANVSEIMQAEVVIDRKVRE
jgi:hypothetical protein